MSRFCTVPVADTVAVNMKPMRPPNTLRGGGGVPLCPLAPGSGRSTVRTKGAALNLNLGSANADLECGPGISGGSRISRGGGQTSIRFCQISQKLHEIESIWTGGALVLRAPLDPPMRIKGRGR